MSHGKLSYKMSGDGRRLVYELQINCKFQYHLGSSRWNTNIFTRSVLLLSGYLVVCFRMVFFRVYLKPEPRPYWPPFAAYSNFPLNLRLFQRSSPGTNFRAPNCYSYPLVVAFCFVIMKLKLSCQR